MEENIKENTKINKKINRGQEHCDREKTNHLERGGGRDQLCGVRNENGGENPEEKKQTGENNKTQSTEKKGGK